MLIDSTSATAIEKVRLMPNGQRKLSPEIINVGHVLIRQPIENPLMIITILGVMQSLKREVVGLCL